MKTCLFLGRFQPFHKGHRSAIVQIHQHGYHKILIGIGSVNQVRSMRNPFSYADTIQMVKLGLKDLVVEHQIVAIPDHESDHEWYTSICKNHTFDAIMTGNDRPAGIFATKGHVVHRPDFDYDTDATRIRGCLSSSQRERAQPHLSPEVYTHLQKIKADTIIQKHS